MCYNFFPKERITMHNELTKKDIQMMQEELDYRRIQLRPKLLEAVKEARSREAIAVAGEMNRAYREDMIGSVQEVLFEDRHLALYAGHTPNYMKVYAAGADLHHRLRQVTITGLYEDGLFGVLKED